MAESDAPRKFKHVTAQQVIKSFSEILVHPDTDLTYADELAQEVVDGYAKLDELLEQSIKDLP